ncbi:MAG: alpha/beta hydrolase [Alphaproteobacteria bacterium]|nr:alpha/beta hydrolase [Alphaproteobacteria bacterium]
MAGEIRVEGLSLETLDLPGAETEPPLVLLHEGLGSVGLWRELPDDLNRVTRRRTIAFSRFGHGRSAPPPAPRTPAFFHEEALAVLPQLLAELSVSDPVLVGHSDGASIALIYAGARLPMAGLVLMAPHVFVEEVTVASIAAAREAYRTTDLPQRLSRYHDDPDGAFRGWNDIWLDPAFRAWNIEASVPEITAPMLLIQGEDDEYGTSAQVETIRRLARVRCELALLPDCGHSPQRDQPARTLELITSFVRSVLR